MRLCKLWLLASSTDDLELFFSSSGSVGSVVEERLVYRQEKREYCTTGVPNL